MADPSWISNIGGGWFYECSAQLYTGEISVIETIMEVEIIDPALAETETMVIFETAVT